MDLLMLGNFQHSQLNHYFYFKDHINFKLSERKEGEKSKSSI
jgi:hypothetical protein